MKSKTIYLALCVLGAALPLWQFIPWLFHPGHGAMQFLRDLFANRISAFFAMDVIVSAVVLIRFVRVESARASVRNWWLPIMSTLLVGVSLGLPMFLYMREARLEEEK
jgi:uncharacterized protein DUF2834